MDSLQANNMFIADDTYSLLWIVGVFGGIVLLVYFDSKKWLCILFNDLKDANIQQQLIAYELSHSEQSNYDGHHNNDDADNRDHYENSSSFHHDNYDDDGSEDSDNNEDDYDEEYNEIDLLDPENDRERLVLDGLFNTMPNLWLKTELLSMDYVFSLPTWKCVTERDNNSGTEYTTCSSDEHSYEENEPQQKEPQRELYDPLPCHLNSHSSIISHQDDSEHSSQKVHTKYDHNRSISLLSIRNNTVINNNTNTNTNNIHYDNQNSKNICRRRRRKRRQFMAKHDSDDNKQPISNAGSDTNTDDCAPKWMIEMNNCAFCLEDYCFGDDLCGLPCAHNFHLNCLSEWFRRDQRCPICRWPSYRFNHPRRRLLSAQTL